MDFTFFNPATFISQLPSASNPFSAMWLLFTNGGWVIVLVTILWGAWALYLYYIQNKYASSVEFKLLAIDVPRENELSPKAVEHIFAHIYGIKKSGNLKERYLKGYFQEARAISLEIVSIEGYIQFLIRTPKKFRDLVEAAIYAQYPDAEITEVHDYVDMIPKPLELDQSDYDIWGTEYKLAQKYFYPLKTYPFFEHSLSQRLMDPMASLLEIMSRMGPGEHSWLQIVISPAGSDWRKEGVALINKLIGKKSAKKGADWSYFPRTITKGFVESFTASIVPPSELGEAANGSKEQQWPSMMQHLSPEEKSKVEGVAMKISKLGFKTKLRYIYAAPKEKLDTGKGAYAINGALAQFSDQNSNEIKINKKTQTKINYFFIKTRLKARKRKILWAYRARSIARGYKPYVFNTEELASMWHFPDIEIRTPTVQRVAAKKAQPPVDLPREEQGAVQQAAEKSKSSTPQTKNAPPDNLPTV